MPRTLGGKDRSADKSAFRKDLRVFCVDLHVFLNFALLSSLSGVVIIYLLSYSLDTYFWSLCDPGNYDSFRGSVMNSRVPDLRV